MSVSSTQKAIGYSCIFISSCLAIPSFLVSYGVGSGTQIDPTFGIIATALSTISISINLVGLATLNLQFKAASSESTSLVPRNINLSQEDKGQNIFLPHVCQFK